MCLLQPTGTENPLKPVSFNKILVRVFYQSLKFFYPSLKMLRYQYHKNAEYRKMLQRISILVMFSLALEMVVAVTETEHK